MEKPLDVSFVPYTPKLVEQDQTIEFRLELQPAVPLVNTALEKYAHRLLMYVFSFGICVFVLFQDSSFVVYFETMTAGGKSSMVVALCLMLNVNHSCLRIISRVLERLVYLVWGGASWELHQQTSSWEAAGSFLLLGRGQGKHLGIFQGEASQGSREEKGDQSDHEPPELDSRCEAELLSKILESSELNQKSNGTAKAASPRASSPPAKRARTM